MSMGSVMSRGSPGKPGELAGRRLFPQQTIREGASSLTHVDVQAVEAVSGRIEVVVVSYRSAPLVQSLLTSWGAAFKVCVADNGNGIDGLDDIVEDYPSARYLQLEGLGFARAANRAILSSTADIVVIANPDCRASADDILRLAAGLASDPDAICHGAVEEISPGRYYCGGWEPDLLRCTVHAFALHRFLPDRGLMAIVDEVGHPPIVDWLSGTVAAFWRHHLLAAGGFDERFYVYTEDMALGIAAAKLGLKHVVRGDVVVHPDTTGSGSPSLPMGGLQGASLAHYFAHYHGRLDGALCRITLATGFLIRALVAVLRGRRQLARRQWRFIYGISTGRAYVEGREVAQSRVRELREKEL